MARSSLRLAVLVCLSMPVFYLFWILFTGTFALHELMIGIGGALLAAGGIFVVNLEYPARFSPDAASLMAFWRLPWYLLTGTWEIAVVAACDLLHIKRAQSLFRVVNFNAGGNHDPHATARRVLAVTYTTVAPNFIVLGINTSDRSLLFHQIERSSVPKMTKSLGAQP